MNIEQLLEKLQSTPEQVEFAEVIETIEQNYLYTPSRFSNGIGEWKQINEAGTNEGSCKIFYFAKLNDLSEEQTLACFGKYYREDVLQNPHGSDHGNIRNFINYGWKGISFDGEALTIKN